jgi:hypothetical protein
MSTIAEFTLFVLVIWFIQNDTVIGLEPVGILFNGEPFCRYWVLPLKLNAFPVTPLTTGGAPIIVRLF